MRRKIRRMTGLVLAVILCFCMLPTTVFAVEYYGGTISSDVEESADTIGLNADTTIAEGVTFALTHLDYQHIELNYYTLTNYGTITTALSSNEFDGGTFYNYGVCEITGFYNVTVYDLTLSSIALSFGTLSPSFAAGTREYAVTVDNSVTSIDITPTLNTGTGVKSMTVNGTTAASGAASTVSLSVGENSIPIVITANDGSDTANTYTLTVTRASAADYTISNASFVSAGSLGMSQDILQWSDVNAPGGYKLEIYTESGTQVYTGTLTNNYTPVSEVLTSSGTYYFTVYALDESGNELSSKISDKFTYTHTHSLTHVETQGATCTEKGNNEYWYCSVCGGYFSDAGALGTTSLSEVTIPAKGHDWGANLYSWSSDWQTCTVTHTCQNDSSHIEVAYATVTSEVTKAATCTAYGEITYTGSFSVDWATQQQRMGIIAATGHSYEAVVTEPTCTTGGYTTYICSVCGDSYTADETEATGHNYESVVTEPTCTEKGYTTYTCKVCGDSYTANETEATGHSWDEGTVTTEATCTEDGVKTYTCEVCGETKTEKIEATGHSYEAVVTEPACTEKGYTTYTCSVCGDSYTADETEATGHSYEAVVTEPTCTEKGYTTYTCSVCADSYTADETEATGHSYEAVITEATYTAQGYTTYTCTHCGDSYEADYTAVKVINETDGNLSTKTTVQELIAVPDGLKNLYSSVDALVSDLIKRVITVGTGYTEDNALVYDVVLQYSTDGGKTWITATVDNFPADGITVTLPYPDGTDSSYEFTVLHMFTVDSDRLGITAGDTESPTVTKTDDGLVFTLTGLSPVAVSWKAVTTSTTETDTSSQTDTTTESTDTSGTSASSTTSAQTGDNSQMMLWLVLLLLSGVGAAGIAVYNTKRRRSR